MLNLYGVVSECLIQLSKSSLQPINKLKLEIELIHTKRLLLALDSRNDDDPKSDADIGCLYSEIYKVCGSDGSENDFRSIIRCLHNIQERLKLELKGG